MFFDIPASTNHNANLLALWFSISDFLECAFSLKTSAGYILTYAPNYILQTIVAAGFALLKLLDSSFADHVDAEYGKTLFTRTIRAIRSISVAFNDLPSRLAEVQAQLWRGGGSGLGMSHNNGNSLDSSLQLKVRCRMSMSLVYDSVWRWREEFQARGKGNLDCKQCCVKNLTSRL